LKRIIRKLTGVLMKIAVPRETWPGERRVALIPASCKKLIQAGIKVEIECGAGAQAYFPDGEYQASGALLVSDLARLFSDADLVLKAQPPAMVSAGRHSEIDLMRPGCMLLATLMPARNLEVVRALAAGRITSFSTDAIPRTTRAQSMDTLSSMANIAGYKGVLLAACEAPKYSRCS
jgi:NAD(P) transhydrogenase subunit alpha